MPNLIPAMKIPFAALACLLMSWAASATPEVQRGQVIYQKLCVECHGKQGEGNEKEFVDPLYGNKSVEALARRIHKTMPEDEEGLCVDEDAAAVAAYIHQAFYAPEAQARLNPPVRDLVRLTVPQFQNSVADVVGRFLGGPFNRLPGEEGVNLQIRGLHKESEAKNKFAQDAKRHQFDKKITSLVFDLRKQIDEEPLTLKSDLQANLGGSLLAEETGNYEFLVRTANGFRLWVNEDDTNRPAGLDGWVTSSKEIREEKINVQLIGGRLYPLRMDFVVSPKDQHATLEVRWKKPHGTLEPIPSRNLYLAHHPTAMVVTAAFPADDASYGYERGSGISKAWLEAVTRGAIEAADFVDSRLDKMAGTKPGQKNRDPKLREFAGRFVETALRRPLDDQEKQLFLEAHFRKAASPAAAIRPMVIQLLTSPQFLYPELPTDQAPDSWQIATRLALSLWDSVPDEPLWKAARENRLTSREALEKQAYRMLGDVRARSKMRGFFHHWLEMERARNVAKDSELFPQFDEGLMADLRTSLDLFLDEIVWGEASDFRQLLLADYLMLNPRLAKVYGRKVEGEGFQRVAFDPNERTGVVTHPYLLSTLAYHNNTSPIHRGVFLTRNIVGQQLKPPPEAIAFKDSDFDPHMTMREKVTELTRDKSCMACHSTINPLGFSLERYDAIGRWRSKEGDKAINTSSEFTPDSGEKVHLTGARDIAEYAASSPSAHRAFVRQMFHHMVKHGMASYGLDTEDVLYKRFKESNFKIRDLVVAIAEEASLDGTPADRITDTAKR